MKTLIRWFICSVVWLTLGDAQGLMDSLSMYHPLHKGNEWIYQRTTYSDPLNPQVSLYQKEVIRDTFINFIPYRVVRRQFLPSTLSGYYYERFDSTTGNYIRYSVQNEMTEDSTATCVPDTKFALFDTRKLKHVRSDILFGIPTLTREIGIANSIAEKDQGWTYAHGIGLVREYISDLANFIYDYKDILLYATINGKEYGTNPLTVNDKDVQSLPSQFALHQNYPNPFNPSTTIRYDLTVPGNVTVKVFDMLGREIAVLIHGEQRAGTYSFRFDASSLASGLYFYQLRAGNFNALKKMSLIK